MAKKVAEKKREAEARASAKFFEQEKAEYNKRMTLAAEADEANAASETEDTAAAGPTAGDDQDENSEENKKGE